MKHRYTAKLYLNDEEFIENFGDDLDQLYIWMSEQAESAFSTIKGEILDNKKNAIIRKFEFIPPEE